MAFRSGLDIAQILEREYRHDIYYAPQGSTFMTCDNPIVTLSPDRDGKAWVGMGFGHAKTQVLFPLNKHAHLLLSRGGTGQKIVASTVKHKQINDMLMGVAQKYAFAPLGQRRLSRIFNDRGCKIIYGQNALVSTPVSFAAES